MFDDLSGKSVLITGASSGIGAAVARGFGRCGARVGVHYHNSAGAADEVAADVRVAGGEAALLQGDVTDPADVARIIEEHLAAFGRLDVLINNAGDVVRRSAFENLSEQLIDDIVALNARSVVTACRLAAPHFIRQGHGNVINTTSLAARQAGGPGASIYAASKGFVQGLTRFLAREYAARNIRVNAVAPGLIITPLQDRNTHGRAARGDDADDSHGPPRPAGGLRRRLSVPRQRCALGLHHRRDDRRQRRRVPELSAAARRSTSANRCPEAAARSGSAGSVRRPRRPPATRPATTRSLLPLPGKGQR